MLARHSTALSAVQGAAAHTLSASRIFPTTIYPDSKEIPSSSPYTEVPKPYLESIDDIIESEVWREVYYARLRDSPEPLNLSSARLFWEAVLRQNVEEFDVLGLSDLSLGRQSLARLCYVLAKGKIPQPPGCCRHNPENGKGMNNGQTPPSLQQPDRISNTSDAKAKDRHRLSVGGRIDNPLYGYKKVDLSCNTLGDHCIQTVGVLLRILGGVKYLDLSNNGITADGAEQLGKLLQDNETLQWLKLGEYTEPKKNRDLSPTYPSVPMASVATVNHNNISAAGLQGLLHSLKENRVLLRLSLCQIGLTEEGGVVLREFFEANQSMNEIELCGNPLGPTGVNKILASGTHLRHLDLTDTQIQGEHIAPTLTQLLRSTTSLASLVLAKNRIGPQAIHSISYAAALCPSLEHLDVNSTYLFSAGLFSFSRSFVDASRERIVALTRLNLSSLQLEPLHPQSAAVALICLCQFLVVSKVSELKLNSNPLGDQGCQVLADALKSDMTRLSVLELSSCRLTDIGVLRLAHALRTNRSLRVLRVNDNFFSGSCEDAIWSAFKRNTTLQEIRMAGARLSHAFLLKIEKLCARNRDHLNTLTCDELRHSISQLLLEEQKLRAIQQEIKREEEQIYQSEQRRKEILDTHRQQSEENEFIKKQLLANLFTTEQALTKTEHLFETHRRILLEAKRDNYILINRKKEEVTAAKSHVAEVHRRLREVQLARKNYDIDILKRQQELTVAISEAKEEHKTLDRHVKEVEEKVRSASGRKLYELKSTSQK